ncbi:MAG TPA: hypothetical protein PLT09_11665 [Deltaproteobacteria bacterium]|nr:hypothetical protein [Deltaproteobacteria bacterium]HPR56263.1 hypothetical protein [Deltaproteobacteria bacterium]HXK48095.1 hypothetical protein [Deltaproteobacteria bacterium]
MAENNSQYYKSNHILSASSNLLGLCFLIFSVVRLSSFRDKTLLDDLCMIAMLMFLASSVLSYISIRSTKKQDVYEKYADMIFIVALGFLCMAAVITAFGVIY